MDLEFFFFQLPQALQFIFKLSYIPRDSDFKELTPEQYAAVYCKSTEEIRSKYKDQKIYAFLPDDIQVNNRLVQCFGDDLIILSELERTYVDKTARYIDTLCSGCNEDLKSIPDQLAYVARTLPEEFSQDTPYAIISKFSRKRNHQDSANDVNHNDF